MKRFIPVDIENQAGQAPRSMAARDIENLALELQEFLDIDEEDQVVVACNPAWADIVRCSWPDCHVRVRGGHNGADRELLAAAKRNTLKRFDAIWIASGDGAFIEMASAARELGLRVVVLSRHNSLSADLHMAADRVITFHWTSRRHVA